MGSGIAMAEKALKPKHIPLRSCVVCREPSDKRTLLRVVRLPEGEREAGKSWVAVDPKGKRSGRGAYVCAEEKCIDLAQKQRRFERALSVPQGNVGLEVFVELKALAAVKQPQIVPVLVGEQAE